MREEKAIRHNQTEFRKRMGTIDNIYVLNYLVKTTRKRKKATELFVDLRTAFDTVDRSVR